MLKFNRSYLQKHINKVHQGNAEIEEVKNLKESSERKKKRGASSQQGPSSAPQYSDAFDVDGGPAAGNTHIQDTGEHEENDREKLDSALGMVLDQPSTAQSFWS